MLKAETLHLHGEARHSKLSTTRKTDWLEYEHCEKEMLGIIKLEKTDVLRIQK